MVIIFGKIFSLFRFKKKDYVIGFSEIAGTLSSYSETFKNSLSVCIHHNSYYNNAYDIQFSKNKILNQLQRIFVSPFLFLYLVEISDNFIYVWHQGVLVSDIDSRKFEFKYLKKQNKRIICYFLGDDIRSDLLLYQLGEDLGLDTISHYRRYTNPAIFNSEIIKKNRAEIVDFYADIVFNKDADQKSYLKCKTYFPRFVINESLFTLYNEKFNNLDVIRIVHAPSSPFIKGTQVIRSVVNSLKEEGYDIEYIELFEQKNYRVLDILKTAHISINQLYAFIPSIFGLESMARNCALFTSGDETIEKDLPEESKHAWVHIKYFNLYSNLKSYLDNPYKLKSIANNGYNYVKKYHSRTSVQKYHEQIIK